MDKAGGVDVGGCGVEVCEDAGCGAGVEGAGWAGMEIAAETTLEGEGGVPGEFELGGEALGERCGGLLEGWGGGEWGDPGGARGDGERGGGGGAQVGEGAESGEGVEEGGREEGG